MGHISPVFAHVYCAQTDGCIKVPLGTEVGLDPGDIVLDGDPAPQRGAALPQFSTHVYCGQTVARLSGGSFIESS